MKMIQGFTHEQGKFFALSTQNSMVQIVTDDGYFYGVFASIKEFKEEFYHTSIYGHGIVSWVATDTDNHYHKDESIRDGQ